MRTLRLSPPPISLFVAMGLIAALVLMACRAQAWHGSPPPQVDIEKTLAALNQAGTDGYSIDVEIAAMQGNAAEVEAVDRLNRARRIAGKLAKFRHLGKLTPYGLATGVAIEIGWHLTGGFGNKHQTLVITGVGNNTTYTVGTASAKRDDWCWYQPNGSSTAGCGDNPQGAVTSYPGCADGCFLLVTRLNGSAMSPTWGGPATSDAIVALTAALSQGMTVGHFYDTAPSGDGVIMRIATEDELMAATRFGVPGPYTNQPVTHTYSGSPDPDYTDGSATDAAVEAELTGGGPEVDLRVGTILDPAYEGETFTWPAPQVTETYNAYVARLQALGWFGNDYTCHARPDQRRC
jgi:hypothetical protein